MSRTIRACNALLDAVPRERVAVRGQSCSSFRLFGLLGVVAAVALTQVLAGATGRSGLVMIILTGAALLASSALALGTVILTGIEKLVCYHHQIAVLMMTAAVLNVLGQPVLAYLDLVVLGLGASLVFGRLGCLLVGCCHGLPSLIGVRYGRSVAESGFDVRLLGARLAPTQLAESVGVLIIVVVGVVGQVRGAHQDGAVFAWWIVAYGLLRFGLEFLRGDVGRPVLAGATEAQWTAVALVWLVIAGETAGVLPAHTSHLVVGVVLLIALASVVAVFRASGRSERRRFDRTLRSPQHVHELAESLSDAVLVADQPASIGWSVSAGGTCGSAEPPPLVLRTSAGVALSSGWMHDPARARFVTVSATPVLTARTAGTLTSLIRRLRFPDQPYRLISGGAGVYHLVILPGVASP